jgi:SAM-dependent methyltransferase
MPDLDSTTESLNLLGDSTRLRLLRLLEAHELTVGEVTAATGLTQSRVSTHLGKLRDAGLLDDRRAGTFTFYRLAQGGLPPRLSRLWELLRRDLDDAVLAADQERAQELIRERADGALWPERVAGEMERHYSPGRTWEATARAFTCLLRLGDVLDVGSGDGSIAELLAPRAHSILCVDHSPRVVAAARARLARQANAECMQGDMHALPVSGARFDQVLMLNVLAYAERPAEALSEAARVLRPGGQLLLVTLDAHDHQAVTASYGHLQPGFAPSDLRAMLLEARLAVDLCEVTSVERRTPRLRVVTALASRPNDAEVPAEH